MNDHLRYLLFRIDDRLLHGQVAFAWGHHLHPRAYLLADDELAGEEANRSLFALAAPPGIEVTVVRLSVVPARPPQVGIVLLVRSVAAAGALLRAGVPGPVNLGGVHHHGTAKQYLPYLFLEEEEREQLQDLLSEGHGFFVQDLPENPVRDLAKLLAQGPDPERR